ncbi:MFS transporter [Christensenella sp. MSJ-20]|uniref:MFS transporter n=1 Tax=Christensenella sp. MSJ-20 TaxID=2841518 RepID=UPI001C756669|nr:MFS transporter [Christensenella sp. MSJ-20]
MEYKVTQRRLNLVEFLYMGSMIGSSYIAMILKNSGMDSVTVGSIQSALACIGMIAPPIAGMIADKIGSVRKTFTVAFTITAIFWLIIPISASIKIAGIPLMVFLLFVDAWSRLPVGSLMDSWLMEVQEAEPRIVYAHARKYGSLGYAFFSLISSLVVAWIAPQYIFYFLPICAIPVLLLCRRIGQTEATAAPAAAPKRDEPKQKLQVGRVFKKYYIMTYFACAIIVWMPFMCSYTMLPYLITDMGADNSMMGIVIGLRALMEVPAFMLVPIIGRRYSSKVVLPLCFAYYAIEQILCALIGGVWLLTGLLMISGMVYAIMLSNSISYVHSMAPPGLNATVVTMNGAVMNLSSILGHLLVGALISGVGIRMCYTIIGAMTAFAAGMMVLFLLFGKKKQIAA